MADSKVIDVQSSELARDITIVVGLDGAAGLQFTCEGDPLSDNEEHLWVNCFHLVENLPQNVTFRIPDFVDNGTTWTVNASPKIQGSGTWARSGSQAVDVASGNTNAFVAVQVTATAGVQTRQKTIHIKIKAKPVQPSREPLTPGSEKLDKIVVVVPGNGIDDNGEKLCDERRVVVECPSDRAVHVRITDVYIPASARLPRD